MIEEYIERHRPILLGKLRDPGTLFIRTHRRLKKGKAVGYTQVSMCDAWKVAIQRYGIYNPYTRRGAIKGLLPHGPHNIRDVLATHVLKRTGSYEIASYAIQSTPEVVAASYGRFLPQDKSEQSGKILDEVWL